MKYSFGVLESTAFICYDEVQYKEQGKTMGENVKRYDI